VLEAAHVLDARAGEELLESYEPERFPVDARNTQRAVENAMNHGALIRAIGIDPEDDPAVNVERSRLLWSDSAEGEALREVAHPVIASQSMEFNEQNVEFGHAYESAAVVPDGTPIVPPVDEIRVYEPGLARPAVRLASPAGLRTCRRDPGPPGPRGRLAHAGRRRGPTRRARRRAAPRPGPLMRGLIDVHAHAVTPDYLAALRVAGISDVEGFPVPEWSEEGHLELLDRHGTSAAVLSFSARDRVRIGQPRPRARAPAQRGGRGAARTHAWPPGPHLARRPTPSCIRSLPTMSLPS
jgi:hypothetical protein